VRNHWATAERRAVLERDYPGGVASGAICATLAALPGPPVPSITNVMVYASTAMKLRRPAGYQSAAARKRQAKMREARI
jgi:hypothetical protein